AGSAPASFATLGGSWGAAMELFTQLFGDVLAFVYHCFDRIVIYGYLSMRGDYVRRPHRALTPRPPRHPTRRFTDRLGCRPRSAFTDGIGKGSAKSWADGSRC